MDAISRQRTTSFNATSLVRFPQLAPNLRQSHYAEAQMSSRIGIAARAQMPVSTRRQLKRPLIVSGRHLRRTGDEAVLRDRGRVPAFKVVLAEKTLEAADLTMERDLLGPLIGRAAFAFANRHRDNMRLRLDLIERNEEAAN